MSEGECWFIGEAVVETTGQSNEWRHTAPLAYVDQGCNVFTLFPGATTDAASIPRLLWTLVGSPMRDSRTFKAASIHDQLYKVGGRVPIPGGPTLCFTRAECDAIFHRALLAAGAPRFRASVYWAGVRVGGWVGWNRYHKAPAEMTRQRRFLCVEVRSCRDK